MDNFQKELTDQILQFRKSRKWEQFHTKKDIAMSLSIETNELLELFLWKNDDEVNTEKLKEEIGDVIYAVILLAHEFKIDVMEAFENKMVQNKLKYPKDKFYGSNKKHNE